MKVILLENLAKIGSIGEVIDVKRGFARNYLISNKKALYASKETIKEVEKIIDDVFEHDIFKFLFSSKDIFCLKLYVFLSRYKIKFKGLSLLIKKSLILWHFLIKIEMY